MSNVFSNSSFAVLSVMHAHNVNTGDDSKTWAGSTAFVQQKPETDYGNIMTVTFDAADWDPQDFDVQDRFDANIASNIMSTIDSIENTSNLMLVLSNSNLSVKSYRMTAAENT